MNGYLFVSTALMVPIVPLGFVIPAIDHEPTQASLFSIQIILFVVQIGSLIIGARKAFTRVS